MKTYIQSLVFLVSVFFILPAQALIVPAQPAKGQFIADTVGIISATDENSIRITASKLLDDLDIPIIVVTIDSLLSYTDGEYLGIERYSKRLFNHWKIGHASHNYGILILISKDDKIARIQFGGGWGFLYDKQAQTIMDKSMTPLFEERKYSEGIKLGVEKLDELSRTELSFLIDEVKIAGMVLIFMLINFVMKFSLIENIDHKFMKHQKLYACFPGFFYLLTFLFYIFGILNHIEFWITFITCLAITLISVLIYSYIYNKTHTLSETVIHAMTVLVMVALMPLFILVGLFLIPRDEYGDGSADMGGGATGEWD